MSISVLHATTKLNAGGAQRMLLKLISGSNSEQFSHSIITLRDGGALVPEFKRLGIPISSMGATGALPTPRLIRKLIQATRWHSPALIQGWMYHGNAAALLGGWFVPESAKVVWNVRHSLHDLSKEKWVTQQIIRLNALTSQFADRILYNSRISAEHHIEHGFSDEKSTVVPNGFDLDVFHPKNGKGFKIRDELNIERDKILIGQVSRLHPMKGHDVFLKAAAEVQKQFPDTHFILIGRHIDESFELRNQISRLGITENISLCGERHDIDQVMPTLDIFTLASKWGEGFPNVIGEAMASGVPCVVTDVGESGYIVGDTGMVVSPDDFNALAEAWFKLANNSPEDRKELGRKARKRIKENFALDQIVSRYEQVYTEVLST